MTAPTFPRSFPTELFVQCDVRPAYRQAAGFAGSGVDFVVERGKPQWTGRWKTNRLTVAETLAWQAWETSLEGGAEFFLGWDALKERPFHYRKTAFPALAGGAPFDGVATVSSIGGNRKSAVLSGLPEYLRLTPGDHLGFRQAIGGVSRYALCEVTDTAQIIASDAGVLTVSFGPKLPAAFTTAAVVDLLRAKGKFRKTTFSCPISGDGGEVPGEVTVEGVSVNI